MEEEGTAGVLGLMIPQAFLLWNRLRSSGQAALLLLSLVFLSSVHAAEPDRPALPFDREIICRLSLDGKPRSLSIRQGTDVWLGYDLERATVLKTWQARPGKPGLTRTEFVTKSAGTAWFEDASDAPWELQRAGKLVPLETRYLGCSQREDHIELRWELRHDAGVIKLHERIPLAAAPAADRVVRELRVESLAEGEALLPPSPMREPWKLATGQVPVEPTITGTKWHRLILP